MKHLEGLNPQQLEAVKHMEDPCLVLASAGSGKTRVLTCRIVNLIEEGVKPSNILAVTFTKKATEEMRDRIGNLIGIDAEELHMGTFHSICYGIVRRYWELKGISARDFAPEWWQKKVIQDLIKKNYLDAEPKSLMSFISSNRNNLIPPDGVFQYRFESDYIEEKYRKIYKGYMNEKTKENKIDFDDMLFMAHDILSNNDSIRNHYQNLYQYVLVDEFQDTNHAQHEVLKLIAGEHRNLFVVGDDLQSLYSFTSANVDIILNFPDIWRAKTIILERNYRSTKNIVDWSNRLVKFNMNQFDKESVANKSELQDPIFFNAHDEEEEAELIVNEIISLNNGGKKYDEFAVLYRTNAQSRALEEELMKSKIPYIVYGSMNFYKRKEIKDMIAYLMLAIDPENDDAFKRVVNSPNRFLGKAFMDKLTQESKKKALSLYEALENTKITSEWRYSGAKQFHEIINSIHMEYRTGAKPSDLMQHIIQKTAYLEWLAKDDFGVSQEDSERIANVVSFTSSASKFETPESFMMYIDLMQNQNKKDEDATNKVKLMTIHKSKGLEFPIVFVAGASDGILPHFRAELPSQVEEERRVMYVAMTRAEEMLYISSIDWYQNRQTLGTTFVSELLKEEDNDTKIKAVS